MNNKHIGIHNSVFRVGVVYSVNGREVKIRVDHNKNSSHLIYKGTLIKNVSVGSYVKILKGYTPIIGKVESEYIDESKQEDKVLISAEDSINRILIVKLIGFIDNQIFRRGVNELPLIDNECHLLTNEEFNLIHTFAGSGKETIEVGHLANDSLVPVNLGIGKLFPVISEYSAIQAQASHIHWLKFIDSFLLIILEIAHLKRMLNFYFLILMESILPIIVLSRILTKKYIN